jgi:hypothetical protein
MPFFEQFPKIQYDFADNGIDTRIVDLFRFIKVDEKYFDDVSTYQYFQIRNGDRPDIVSNLLYNTPDYYWTFFLVNDHLKSGLSGWPMMQEELDDYLEIEYSGTAIQTTPIIVRDGDDIITEYRNSLAGRFQIGETVYGSESGAYGRLAMKDTQLSQLVIKEVVGTFQENEFITGSTTEDSVASNAVFNYVEAPRHYQNPQGSIYYTPSSINEQKTNAGVDPAGTNPVLIPVSNREYEISLNDQRSNIRVIRSGSIYKFAQIYQGLING